MFEVYSTCIKRPQQEGEKSESRDEQEPSEKLKRKVEATTLGYADI